MGHQLVLLMANQAILSVPWVFIHRYDGQRDASAVSETLRSTMIVGTKKSMEAWIQRKRRRQNHGQLEDQTFRKVNPWMLQQIQLQHNAFLPTHLQQQQHLQQKLKKTYRNGKELF